MHKILRSQPGCLLERGVRAQGFSERSALIVGMIFQAHLLCCAIPIGCLAVQGVPDCAAPPLACMHISGSAVLKTIAIMERELLSVAAGGRFPALIAATPMWAADQH